MSRPLSLPQELEMDRARMAAGLDHIYRVAGFAAAVTTHQEIMRALVERAKAEGAKGLEGWIA